MILIIDNTKNLNSSKMTPKLIKVIENLDLKYIIVSTKETLLTIIHNDRIFSKIIGIILSGGYFCLSNNCIYNDISKNIVTIMVFKNIPILGICFGFQLLCDLYGGTVLKLPIKNEGIKQVDFSESKLTLLKNIDYPCSIYFSHFDYIEKGPLHFNLLKNKHNHIIGFENIEKQLFGFQFHPEGTNNGIKIIENFITLYCLSSL